MAWLDVLRALLVVVVVLGHVLLFMGRRGLAGEELEPLVRLLQHVRLPLLFLVSGMLFSAYRDRPWRSVTRNRLLVMLWILVVWLVVERLVRVPIGSLPVPTVPELAAYVGRNVLVPADYLWFVWSLAVMTVVAWLCRHTMWVLVPLFLLGTSGVAGVLLPPDLLGRQTQPILSDSPYFLAGFVLAPALLRGAQHVGVGVTAAAAAAFAGTAVVLVHLLPASGMAVPGALVSSALVLTALPLAAGLARAIARLPGGGLLAALGRRTLPVYVVHFPAVLLLMLLLDRYREVAEPRPELVALVLTAAAVAAGLLLHRLLAAVSLRGVVDVPSWLYAFHDWVAGPPHGHPRPSGPEVVPAVTPRAADDRSV